MASHNEYYDGVRESLVSSTAASPLPDTQGVSSSKTLSLLVSSTPSIPVSPDSTPPSPHPTPLSNPPLPWFSGLPRAPSPPLQSAPPSFQARRIAISVRNLKLSLSFYAYVFNFEYFNCKTCPHDPPAQHFASERNICDNVVEQENTEGSEQILIIRVIKEEMKGILEKVGKAGGLVERTPEDLDDLITTGILDPSGNRFELLIVD